MDADVEARGASAPPLKSEKDAADAHDPSLSSSTDNMAAADDSSAAAHKPWHKRAIAYFTANTMEASAQGPTPLEKRTDRRAYTGFTLWFTLNCNILPITFGMLGPEFGCSLRDSALVALFFTLLTALAPAYFSTLGPQTGMRQMMQARYSFGRYIVSIPVLLNMATLTGFCVIMVVIGGQCLTAVSGGSLSPYVGIVVMSLVALFVSFCGYKVLHVYEKYSWAPALLAIVVATGCGGKHLKEQTAVDASPAAAVVSFGMVVASYMLPWAAIASDFFTYVDPRVRPRTIFLSSYAGLVLSTVPLMTLGAAIAGALANVPAWNDGYEANMVGGVLDAMLQPAGGFGRFMTVLLALSLIGNTSATSYAITVNFPMLVPALGRVPRHLYAVFLAAVVIGVGIGASKDFYNNLNNFITLIGYWAAAFIAAFLVEHLWFRRGDCRNYDPRDWDSAGRLPLGIAAICAGLCSVALIVPSMSQVWYVGPIAETTGDLGFEFAFVVTALLYGPFRLLEKKLSGR
ncbi:hypothetical protein SPBR_08978 [Sporothrix brasiliensis 5110]|uniref:Cytosine-purine permease n=1 Tax=Sporothrix brasiliensis 5110 TaxID=1398154 RepID=A0A0C2IKW8_9PEZI|nr:uncharacterized protein SPBR_08978 [Sporothrix brasiliensis 5110]KIH89741.1 hypothetical protein SPBR_08978 [Sporothrix brasiliensis 5110]